MTGDTVGEALRADAYAQYKHGGQRAVEEWAGDRFSWSNCEPCEEETPTITVNGIPECAVCGTPKEAA